MRNIWEKIKIFFVEIWNGLTRVGRILLGLILVAAIVLVGFLVNGKSTDDAENVDSNRTPEIAQVYEPSIGTPLPPDNPGAVGGATTTEPSDQTHDHETTAFVAPHTGTDPNEPVAYSSTDLNFAAVLPVGSEVKEDGTRTMFTSPTGSLYYVVSVNQSTESLSDIELQLRNSPTAGNISYSDFSNTKALKFSAKGYGAGLVFVSNGKIYYLLGNKEYFSTFKLL
jgi:hypothetical protein